MSLVPNERDILNPIGSDVTNNANVHEIADQSLVPNYSFRFKKSH